jgi:hypothetical protein
MARAFPEVQFYDYTKHPKPWLRTLPNYHLTFSHSGHNVADCLEALQHGINVAVVFSTRRGEPLPETWNGSPVIDGDLHDCRFLDSAGVVVGLRAKGMAKARNPRSLCWRHRSLRMALILRRAWRANLMTLSEWYRRGDRALWRHLKTTLGLEARAQRKLESASAYCRTQYISALTRERGPEEAQRILDREEPV